MCDSGSDSEHKSGSSASTSISAVSHHCTNVALPPVPEDGYTGHAKSRRLEPVSQGTLWAAVKSLYLMTD